MAQQQSPDTMDQTPVDPKMLENLELLMNMEVLEQEADWDNIENMDKEDADEADNEA